MKREVYKKVLFLVLAIFVLALFLCLVFVTEYRKSHKLFVYSVIKL